jgi:hypothetical protein
MASMLLGNFVPCVLEKEKKVEEKFGFDLVFFWAAAFGECFC